MPARAARGRVWWCATPYGAEAASGPVLGRRGQPSTESQSSVQGGGSMLRLTVGLGGLALVPVLLAKPNDEFANGRVEAIVMAAVLGRSTL